MSGAAPLRVEKTSRPLSRFACLAWPSSRETGKSLPKGMTQRPSPVELPSTLRGAARAGLLSDRRRQRGGTPEKAQVLFQSQFVAGPTGRQLDIVVADHIVL